MTLYYPVKRGQLSARPIKHNQTANQPEMMSELCRAIDGC